MVRNALLALIFLFGAIVSRAAPASLRFDGETFHSVFNDRGEAGPFTEYLRKGENLDTWVKLMGVYQFPKLKDPTEAVKAFADGVKASNPQAQTAMISNPDTGEAILDFVTWTEDGSFVEFNVWKYRKNPDGGLVALQFAQRCYDKDPEAFFKKLRSERLRLVALMAKMKF